MFHTRTLFFFAVALVLGSAYAFIVIGIGSYFSWPNAEVLYLTGDVKASHVFYAAEKLLLNYDGRYFTNLLHGLNPVAWGWLWGYKIMPLLGVALFLTSVYFWLTSLVTISRLSAFAFSLAFTVVHFAISPMIVSELFNMIGSFVYLYSMCFWMVWTGASWRFIHGKNQQQENFWFFLSAIALTASTGCSEQILMLNALTLLFLFLLCCFCCKENLLRLVPLLAVGFVSVVFFVSCPGWRIRLLMENPVGHTSHTHILSLSLQHYVTILVQLFSKSGFLFSALLLIGISIPPVKLIYPPNGMSKNRLLVVSVFLFFFLASYCMALAYYLPMGNDTGVPYRIYNPINTLLQLLFCVVFLCSSSPFILHRGLIQLFFLFWCVVSLLFGSNNYQQIANEYQSGCYSDFDTKINKQLRVLAQSRNSQKVWKKACLESFSVKQTAIYYPVELQPNRAIDNRNVAYEKYFGIDEVCFCADTFSKAKALIQILHE